MMFAVQGATSSRPMPSAIAMCSMSAFIPGRHCEVMLFGGCYLGPHLETIGQLQRQAVEQAGKDTEEPMLKIAIEFDAKAEQLWKDNGAEIIRLPPADKTEFMKRARAVGEQVLSGDPATKDLFEVFKRIAEKHRKKA